MLLKCHSGSDCFDNINPIFLRTFASVKVPTITEIIKKFVDERIIPTSCKTAVIKPLHKKSNHRAVSILSLCNI